MLPKLELHSFYSQTEAGLVCNLRLDEQTKFFGSLGKPVKGVEVKIVNQKLQDVSPGESGKILVRCGMSGSISVMREYFRQPEETGNFLPMVGYGQVTWQRPILRRISILLPAFKT